jgi:hypothetical protein
MTFRPGVSGNPHGKAPHASPAQSGVHASERSADFRYWGVDRIQRTRLPNDMNDPELEVGYPPINVIA